MKIYCLHPIDEQGWLAPTELVERLRGAFEHVITDEEAGREYATIYVNTYRRMVEAGVGAPHAASVEAVERQWRDATVVEVSDDRSPIAPCEMLVRREYRLELRFAPGTKVTLKQRTAQEVASALGYRVVCFDPEA